MQVDDGFVPRMPRMILASAHADPQKEGYPGQERYARARFLRRQARPQTRAEEINGGVVYEFGDPRATSWP